MKVLRSSFWFLFTLFLNGVGSSTMLVLLPYSQLAGTGHYANALLTQGTLASSVVLGSVLWGRVLDRTNNIWKIRSRVFVLEITVAVCVAVALTCNWPAALVLGLIALQQFLFPFEIIWSRIAWKQMPANASKSPESLGRQFILATSLISCVGPGLGAYLGTTQWLALAGWLDVLTYLPYLTACVAHIKYVEPVPTPTSFSTMDETRLKPSIGLLAFLRSHPGEGVFLWSVLASGFLFQSLLAVLPIIILLGGNPGGEQKGVQINSALLPVFYCASGALAALAGSGRLNCIIPSFLRGFTFKCSVLLTALAVALVLTPVPTVRMLVYLCFTAIWANLSRAVLARIYRKTFDRVRARVLSLLRATADIYYPVFAITLACIGTASFEPAIVLVCLFWGICFMVTSRRAGKTCLAAHEGGEVP